MAKYYLKTSQRSSFIAFVLLLFALIKPAESAVPNDARFSLQAPFYDKISASQAWDLITSTQNVVVAIIDTGVDISNTDLKENIWNNKNEVPGNNLDDE